MNAQHARVVVALVFHAAAALATTRANAQVIPRRPNMPSPTPTVGQRIQPIPARPSIWGFADLHVHQFNNLGFGGKMFWGMPYGPLDKALPWCTDAHGWGGVGDIIGNTMSLMARPSTDAAVAAGTGAVVGAGLGGVVGAAAGAGIGGALGSGHKVGGNPQFDGWPRWDSFTHQQVYADWLKRALDGGLKLIVMYAGNNEVLCAKANKAPGRTCDDMEAVRIELDSAKAMERYIDAQSGGAGQGWYRLVYSAQEARDAIARGQLAVVLGAEVPTLFGCRVGRCTPQSVHDELARYYALGIRELFPIHNADNAFGGSAVYNDLFNLSNKTIAGSYFSVEDCSDQGVKFHFAVGAAVAAVDAKLAALGGADYKPPAYPGTGHCNARGLTPLGDFFIREMMSRKMVIDVDHMSWKTMASVFAIADANQYPLVSSHTGFLDISRGEKASEGQKTPAQMQAIRKNGGLIAAILFQGSRSETQNPASPIPHDCGNSSQSWAQAYLYAVQQLGGSTPVALGSDFNGLAGMPSPRFGPDACTRGDRGPNAEMGGRVTYPFQAHGVPGRMLDRSTVGNRVFDYNEDGLAHVGMLPDMIQDLKVQGMTDAQLDPLFHSAEAYIQMWERIERTNVAPPHIPVPPEIVVEVVDGALNPTTHKASLTVTARDKETGQVRSGTVIIDNEKGALQTQGPTGALLQYKPCREFDPAAKAYVGPGACTGRVMVAGYPPVTFDANGGL